MLTSSTRLPTQEPSATTIQSAADGDKTAQAHVVAAVQNLVYTLARRMLLSPVDAEDATQEALLKVLNKLDTFRGESHFTTWVHSVAAHSILDFRRGQARQPVLTPDVIQADLADGLEPSAPERAEDHVFLGQLMVGCTRALLQCLDGEHRLAYVVGEVMDLDGPEGAAVCGVSDAAFRKRLSRARELVKGWLKQQCGVFEPSVPCRCHRRLNKAMKLGRAGPHLPEYTVDVTRVREALHQIDSLSHRAAALYGADPVDVVPPALADRIRAMSL